MPIRGEEAERQAALEGAQTILAVARTAPKARGIDRVVTAVVADRAEVEALAKAMEALGEKRPTFARDAEGIRRSVAVALIGVKGLKSKGLNCGACGYSTCAEFDAAVKKAGPAYMGPNCAFYLIDLGIALGVAAKKAMELGLDNRIMFSAGTAARSLGLLDADVALGMPLSVTGKNPYFDRVWPK
ncbi:MAG: DUF2148 domain-containing protein [Candidatus Bathyarchaeia archaeon]